MEPNDRNTYLIDIPLAEAIERFHNVLNDLGYLAPLASEQVAVRDALNRVTAEPVWAKRSSPHYNASAMDGYAVRAHETLHATETQPIMLRLGEQAYAVNTGAPLPEDTNAVVMIEHVQHPTDDDIEIVNPVPPWQHVRMMGEDMVATELVLPSNHRIRPVDLGAIAGCGHHLVQVRRKPRVVLIPTGSELITVDQEPKPGQIIEYNSMVLAAQILEQGGVPIILPITPDHHEALVQKVYDAVAQSPDLILILSGSSAGSKDFTASIVDEVGTLLVHGVAVRPGHPVIMGIIENIPTIGVPGYPVSAALTGEIFVEPLLAIWQGLPNPGDQRAKVDAKMTRKLTSHMGDDDYVRVTVTRVDEQYLATPISKGAGVITSLVRADGIAHVPRFSEGIDIGEMVSIQLYRSLREINQSIQVMGSHDPMLDLLSQHIAGQYGLRLVSANVGSMGGLVALRRGESHLAGCHLLDNETGIYNISFVQRHLRDTPLMMVTFTHREQGFIVPKRNPKGIKGIEDLYRIRYVNRQRGAGTRLLLDYELNKRGIEPDQVIGYEREEYTHLGVAAAVATGIADCGLGVRSAAIALDLDFIPFGWERFDLVIPQKYQDLPGVVAVLDVLNSSAFQAELNHQPGYDATETGRVQYQQTK